MMLHTIAILLSLQVFVCLAAAGSSNVGAIEGKLQFPDKRAFTETSKISLDHDSQHTYSRPDGSFIFFNVQPGVHVIDVYNQAFHFPQIKCQFLEGEMDRPNCISYLFPGANKLQTTHPLILTALASIEYFEAKRGFSILSIIKNPMMLMMLFTVGMVYLMPKMMEGMDPEEKARFKQQMAMQNDPKKMLGQLFGDVSGGSGEAKSITSK